MSKGRPFKKGSGRPWGTSKGSWRIKVVVPGGQGGVYWVAEGRGGHLMEPRVSRGTRESQDVCGSQGF